MLLPRARAASQQVLRTPTGRVLRTSTGRALRIYRAGTPHVRRTGTPHVCRMGAPYVCRGEFRSGIRPLERQVLRLLGTTDFLSPTITQ